MLQLLEQFNPGCQPDASLLSIVDADLRSRLSGQSLDCSVRTDHLKIIVVIKDRFLLIGTSHRNESGLQVHIEEQANNGFLFSRLLFLKVSWLSVSDWPRREHNGNQNDSEQYT